MSVSSLSFRAIWDSQEANFVTCNLDRDEYLISHYLYLLIRWKQMQNQALFFALVFASILYPVVGSRIIKPLIPKCVYIFVVYIICDGAFKDHN